MGMGSCRTMNCRATVLAIKNISVATRRQTLPITTKASKDAACITYTGRVTVPELGWVFVASSSHQAAPMQVKSAANLEIIFSHSSRWKSSEAELMQ